MPHAELRYSADLDIDAREVFELIEDRINAHDPGAGECKGRAYPSTEFHHTHLLIEISMLSKPNRDLGFTEAVRDDIESAVKSCLRQRCFFSLSIRYSDATYITNEFVPATG